MTGIRRHGIGAMETVTLITAILANTFMTGVDSRYLRPSDHGLRFQNLQSKSSPQMAAFFVGKMDPPPPSPPPPPQDSSATEDPWWTEAPEREEVKVRKVLMVAAVVCGGIGVVLLLAAAVLFVLHYRRGGLVSLTSSSVVGRQNSAYTAVPLTPLPSSHSQGKFYSPIL